MAEGNKPVTFKPYERQGEQLIAGMFDGRGLNITATEYHGARQSIVAMRAKDPAASALYDRYLTEVVSGKKEWSQADIKKLDDAVGKHGVGRNPLMNDVGRDLKAHGYSPNYRPSVAIEVNGRPMHPEVIASEYRARGVEVQGQIPTSHAPGKVAGGIHVDAGDAQKFATKFAEESTERGFRKTGAMLFGELAEHGKKFGAVGKLAGGVAAATIAMAGNASAAEVASETANAMVPGAGSIGKAVLGDGPKRGHLCEAFGQVTGAVSGTGAGIVVGAATSLTGPGAVALGVGAGVVTDAVVTPVAEKSCNWVAQKLGF